MRKLYFLANVALFVPAVVYLLSLVLRQFTNTVWWYRSVWDPISDVALGYAFFGLPFVALAFIFSTPAMGIFTRVVKVILSICFAAFILMHLFFLFRMGTLFPEDFGTSITAFVFLMIAGPLFFFGSLLLSILAARRKVRTPLQMGSNGV